MTARSDSAVLRLAIDVLVRMSNLFKLEEYKFYIYFFLPFATPWGLGRQEPLSSACLSTELDTERSLWNGPTNVMALKTRLPEFFALLGRGPCSPQVSPKSFCPNISFSSWKRKLALKAAPLFVRFNLQLSGSNRRGAWPVCSVLSDQVRPGITASYIQGS